MSEPKPMKQIHDIQEKIYEEIKHMSGDERLEYFHQQSEKFKKEMKDIKPVKDLKTLFADLDKKQQAG